MTTVATRTLASVLAALLAVSCGTVRESRQPDTEVRVFLPRAPRAVASPVLEDLELRRAIEEVLPHVNVEEVRAEMVADPRFHGRQPGELRVVLASWGSGPAALEEIARGYRAFCAAVRRTNCLQGPLTASSVYQIAFDFALGSQWDGFAGELKSTIDPLTIQIVLLTGMVIFMATLAFPELTSKIPAAAATMVLTAYLGARAVCDLIFGWIQMVRELDAATTFDQVRSAGQRYGHVVGAQTARTLVLLATAAIAQGGVIARLMKLPRATQASAALAAETGGVGLGAVGAVKEVRVLQGGVAITVKGAATGAVGVAAMAAHGAPQQSDQPPLGPAARGPQRSPHTTEVQAAGTPPAKDAKGLGNLPIHPRRDRFFVRAGELANETRVVQDHPLNRSQMLGGPEVGHGGVRNLSNDELTRFGGPQGTDPIRGFRAYRPGDDLGLPGPEIHLRGGHHRAAEIGRRVRAGQMDPDTLIEVEVSRP
jgi:hypothetical protein